MTDKEAKFGKQVSQEEVDAVSCGSLLSAVAGWATNPIRVFWSLVRIVMITALLFGFLFFLDMMGTSFKVIGGCTGGELFGDGLDNPIAGLVVGILATVFVQSSSTSTSIVVSLVGADAMTVKTAIPVIMGANIGTSVTNTIVSMYYVREGDYLERAFAGATVHDMFNMCTVGLLLPIEIIVTWLSGGDGGLLYHFSEAVKPNDVKKDEKWVGPLKKIVSPVTAEFLMANKDVMKSVATGKYTCEQIYSTHTKCETPSTVGGVTYDEGCACDVKDEFYTCTNAGVETVTDKVCDCPTYIKGLMKAGSKFNAWTGKEKDIEPIFYEKYASQTEDMTSATVTLIISLVGLCTCMACLVKILSHITRNSNQAMLKKAASMDPYFAIGVGTAITVLVQSSSITTSVLTPLAASDIISLEQMLPLTLGANIGTTWTSILASLVSSKVESVQIAICHLSFNILGIFIWYGPPIPLCQPGPCSGGPPGRGVLCSGPGYEYQWPVPFPYKKADGKQLQMRDVPLNMARYLGKATRSFNLFPLIYIFVMFVCVPGILYVVSSLVTGTPAQAAFGWLILILVVFAVLRTIYWLARQGGFKSVATYLEGRQAKTEFMKNLQTTIEQLQADVAELKGNKV